MAPAYKLTYFNIPALAEPIRFLLGYGKVEFEDKRIAFNEWTALKPTTPMGQVPILEHNGKVAHQHISICRYIAKQIKLVGANDWENMEIDIAVDTVNDLRQKIAQYYYERDEDIKEKRKGPLFETTIPFYIGILEDQIKKNNGYLAVGKLTWADVYFVGLLEYMTHMTGNDLLENAPGLRKLKEEVLAATGVKAYLDKRPKCDF